jgi:ATP-dependent Clp protease ATP-binding subunit ClpA
MLFDRTKLSREAGKVMILARAETARLHHEAIYPLHILLAFTVFSDDIKAILAEAGLTEEVVRDEVRSLYPESHGTKSVDGLSYGPFTAGSIVEEASLYAKDHGDSTRLARPDHLFLSLTDHAILARDTELLDPQFCTFIENTGVDVVELHARAYYRRNVLDQAEAGNAIDPAADREVHQIGELTSEPFIEAP